MKTSRLFLGLAAACALAVSLAGSATGVGGVGVPANVVTYTPEKIFLKNDPVTDFGATDSTSDDRTGTTQWRVATNTGNCCENHYTTSKEGRIFDIGGRYVIYTDDRGLTWKAVQPQNPLVNAEGSMAIAPNDDVVAMTWDAYSGDHFVAYKFTKGAAAPLDWTTAENPIHEVVYDRPWLTVIPGPFTYAPGLTVPYISLVQGGIDSKDPMWVSADGLSYPEPSSFSYDPRTRPPLTQWYPIQANASFDWIQPIRSAPVTGLGAGYAIGSTTFLFSYLLDPTDRTWHNWTLPDGSVPPTFIQIDSAGRINWVVKLDGAFEYRISTDGGRTWTTSGAIPYSLGVGMLNDFKANYAVGIAAVSVRVGDQDWLYKLDISTAKARLTRVYKLGLGDTNATSGVVIPPSPRFDFKSVGILPDGRVVTSVSDSSTFSHPAGIGGIDGIVTPAAAIELDTALSPTAVTTYWFRAHRTGKAVELGWRTAQETDLLSFQLYRDGKRVGGLIAAKRSGESRGATYRFVDRRAGSVYRLEGVKLNGARVRLASTSSH
jgi:hypothetical protein